MAAILRTDQPGRVVAVAVVSPTLLFKGIAYDDPFIFGFAIVLFLWDAYWLAARLPKRPRRGHDAV